MEQDPTDIKNKKESLDKSTGTSWNKDMLTYWDYIKVDALLDLQQPRTDYPDEKVFITYHQISELYFKLMLQEIQLIQDQTATDVQNFLDKVLRLNRYAEQLASSMEIMTDGLDHQQFLKFRKDLYPASGFQSAQFRKIELNITSLPCLVSFSLRDKIDQEEDPEKIFEQIYWKRGATDLQTGEKSITLVHFEDKYNDILLEEVKRVDRNNIYEIYLRSYADFEDQALIEALREFDFLINIRWRLAHFKSAAKHLATDPSLPDKESTGGTNWKEFLPPRFQKNIFFPLLWKDLEVDEWGKRWVIDIMR